MNICTDLLRHAEADKNLMEIIITGYETLVHVYFFRNEATIFMGEVRIVTGMRFCLVVVSQNL